MNTLLDTLQYFVFITIELIALFMLISAAVEIILMYIPEEKIRDAARITADHIEFLESEG
mgnify:CR=1 FL=1